MTIWLERLQTKPVKVVCPIKIFKKFLKWNYQIIYWIIFQWMNNNTKKLVCQVVSTILLLLFISIILLLLFISTILLLLFIWFTNLKITAKIILIITAWNLTICYIHSFIHLVIIQIVSLKLLFKLYHSNYYSNCNTEIYHIY